MIIGIDLRTLSEGKTTGVEVYAYNLVKKLLEIDSVNEYVFFYSAWKHLPNFFESELPDNAHLHAVKIPNRLLNASQLFLGFPKLDRLLGGIDLFFSPRFLFTSLSRGCPLVVTVHDLSFVHNPQWFSAKQRIWHKIISDERAIKKARKVIAVSESTKKDIVKYFKVRQDKVSVIYPGVTFRHVTSTEIAQVLEKFNIKSGYILHLATIEPRKNTVGVIEAYESLRKNSTQQTKLVIAGSLGWLYNETLRRVESSLYKSDIVFVRNFSEKEKCALYQGADCFLFPSFYEGFGFPPLEALAAGIPVITSGNSSLSEVLGDAALYVNPYRIDEIELALRQVLSDSQLRETLIKKGKKRVAEYTWESSARQTLNVFESAKQKAQSEK